MQSRSGYIALGKALSAHIEPTHTLVAQHSDDSFHAVKRATMSSFAVYKNAKTLEPQVFILTDNLFAEMGEKYLEFLRNSNVHTTYSTALLNQLQRVTGSSHEALNQTLRQLTMQTVQDNTLDLVMASACDILNANNQTPTYYRREVLTLIEEYHTEKMIHGDILNQFKINRSATLREQHPAAWAVEYKMDYQARVMYSNFCWVFSQYAIDLNQYSSRYKPMLAHEVSQQGAYALQLTLSTAWLTATKQFHQAIASANLNEATRIIATMTVEKDSQHYASYLDLRKQLDNLFAHKMKTFGVSTFFKINPAVEKECQELMSTHNTPSLSR